MKLNHCELGADVWADRTGAYAINLLERDRQCDKSVEKRTSKPLEQLFWDHWMSSPYIKLLLRLPGQI